MRAAGPGGPATLAAAWSSLPGTLPSSGLGLLIVLTLLQQGVDHHQHPVGQRHQGLLPTQPRRLPGILPLEARPLGAAGRPGHLDQRGAQPLVPLGRLGPAALLAALVVAGTQTGPRAELTRARE